MQQLNMGTYYLHCIYIFDSNSTIFNFYANLNYEIINGFLSFNEQKLEHNEL